jgi:hypothetical protein
MKATDPSFKLRIPPAVKEWLADEAERNQRTQSAEIIFCLKQEMARRASEPATGQASQA